MCSVLLMQSILSGFFFLCYGRRVRAEYLSWIAAVSAVVSAAIVAAMGYYFTPGGDGVAFVENVAWIEQLGVRYHVGVDGFSLVFCAMTVLITCAVVSSEEAKGLEASRCLGLTFLAQASALGVFMARDGLLFYFFWESSLIPLFLAIGMDGSQLRRGAAYKFFVYTFVCSALLLLAVLFLGYKSQSYDLASWERLPLGFYEQSILFWISVLACAVKVPLVPLHTWLPDAHPEAPTYGSVILAATMLKLGGYGFLRLVLPVFPEASSYFAWVMLALALCALVYAGLLAWVEEDVKKLIAYSSIVHMAVVVLGLFVVFECPPAVARDVGALAVVGAIVQMLAHAFSSGGLFMGFGALYKRIGKRMMQDYGGVGSVMPLLSLLFCGLMFNNSALPGTSGFVGEFLVLVGVFHVHPLLALVAASSVLLTALYGLLCVRKVFFGQVVSFEVDSMARLSAREAMPLILFSAAALWVGLYPRGVTTVLMEPATQLVVSMLRANKAVGG